ncbi:TetR/AcrR family transcriptional regulator [Nocardia goodfellowii]|uniref:AcrR family transcriptional regulator n=1 Tax=Nocardia goodfellowii TaxID=882446 RepID=A0ABS4QLC9_9NOCA|nr:TetR/AcrR family transcriptional regulator [Nocardia goodfellowii]MBP2192513.1 AcrR family transcriptional regulator [Nocardia goodfellowii]
METQRRPGGRSARVRDAVRQATLVEVTQRGYQGLTVENVAKRSGVHKTSIYRRWGSPEGLVADALELAATEPIPIPDTGSVDSDLRALAEAVRAGFASPQGGAIGCAFILAGMQNPAAATALQSFIAARRRQSLVIVDRAVQRGELSPAVDGEELIRFALAPIYYRIFVTHEPPTAQDAHKSADAALAAARAGIL